jgi:hypothetical protein
MQRLGYKLLNDITWVKPNPPPNLSCRYFTHATETIIWAGRDKKCRHKFNYALMKSLNRGKQMLSVWTLEAPRREEKVFGKHPTQKSLALLERIIAAASDENDLVLDPFSGSGTTGIVAARLGRPFIGVDLDSSFLDMATRRFVGVPQADSPERILAVVRAHAVAEPTPATLAESLAITERQVHYYRQAALVLGLLMRSPCGWKTTEEGNALCAAEEAGGRKVLAASILGHPLVAMALAKCRHLRDPEGRRQAVARLLYLGTALSESTCQRRAQTLLAWIQWAQEMSAGLPCLFHDITPAAEEPDDAAVA